MILVHLIRNERMNVSRIFLFAVGIFAATQLVAQSPSPQILVKAGRLLDPRSGNVLSAAAVLIEKGKIKEVGPVSQVQPHTSAGTKTIDMGNAILLPGLKTGSNSIYPIQSVLRRHKASGLSSSPFPQRLRHQPTRMRLTLFASIRRQMTN